MVILEKLITDLKSKLPLKKAKGQSDELEEIDDEKTDPSRDLDRTNITDVKEVEEESAGTNSFVDKLKDKIKGLNKSKTQSSDDASDESEEVSDEEAKKKKKSKILQIVIGVGLVLFLLSDYIIPTEDAEKAPEAASFKRPDRKKPTPKEAPAVATETPAETPAEAPIETPTEASGEQTTEVPSETPTEAPVETAAQTPMETPAETTTAPTETPSDVATETTPDSPVTVTSESAPTEEPTTTEAPTEIDLTGTDTSTNTTVDSVDGTETTPTGDENLTDQILQDLEKQAKKDQVVKEQKKEYVSPPDYEYRGRGLVYNCKGKHWACIDAPSYKICEDNASSVKFLKKRTECHPFNVYETPKGCESMQNRMVSSSAKTNFCND